MDEPNEVRRRETLMPRPPRKRRVGFVPEITYFKPAGVPLKELDEIMLSVEELEAIRLKDIEGHDQQACADKMDVSRATFQNVLSNARGKVARALVHGRAIRIQGGIYQVAETGEGDYEHDRAHGKGMGRSRGSDKEWGGPHGGPPH